MIGHVLTLQILTTFSVSMWFFFGLHRVALKLMHKNAWDDLKPFTCRLCMGIWLGAIVMSYYFVWSGYAQIETYQTLGLFFCSNYLVSKVYDRLFGGTIQNLEEEVSNLKNQIKKFKS